MLRSSRNRLLGVIDDQRLAELAVDLPVGEVEILAGSVG